MKQFGILIYILLGFIALWSCDSQPLPSTHPDIVKHIYSRNIITATSIPKDQEALFCAKGQTSFTNQVFKFNGNYWENAETSIPIGKIDSLTALYPAYNGEGNFITLSPYTEEALEDVLISPNAITDQTNLKLEFKHLFAKLTLHVESEIQETLTGISLKAPKVSAIHPISGNLDFSGDHTTYLSKNATGDYIFMIPYKNNCTLELTFIMQNDETSESITHNFESGHHYECNVTYTDNQPGIKTIDDLIDFSLFINGKSDKRPWSDFGIETSEGRVYRLLADLDFENKIYSNLLPIGYAYSNSSIFNDIFDGGGHTISNLVIPDKSINSNVQTNYSGIFGHIGENGIVRSLNINNANSLETPTCTHIGGIASKNSGTIINCSVQNSTFHALEDAYIGGICSRLSAGYIINCYTSNDTIHSNKRAFTGGIAGDANGYILNCYAYKNRFFTTDCTKSKNGGFVGNASSDFLLSIINCYVYHNIIPKNYWGAAIGLAKNATIDYFMYNHVSTIFLEKQSGVTTTPYVQKYESYKVNETHISTILNNWIDNPNRTEYTDIAFKHWTETNPPVFAE